MKKWQCMTCGFIYDEAEGWPDDGINPGTRWEDVSEDWDRRGDREAFGHRGRKGGRYRADGRGA